MLQVKGAYIANEHFLSVVDTGNGGLSLANEMVIVDVVRQATHLCIRWGSNMVNITLAK